MRFAALLLLHGAILGVRVFAAAPDSASALLNSLPLRFEQETPGHWSARGNGFAIAFRDSETALRLGDRIVRIGFDGAKNAARFEGSGKEQAPTNYFTRGAYHSSDAYSRLSRKQVYPGIDVVYYGQGSQLEYDFNLAPGADPSRIRMRFAGADSVTLNAQGEIALKLGASEIIQRLPVVYQRVSGGKDSGKSVPVEARYQRRSDGSFGVVLGAYNRAQALVIDPALVYTAFLSGSNADSGVSVGHDAHGFIYLAGYTYSIDFPASDATPDGTPLSVQLGYNSGRDGWITKMNIHAPAGTPIIVYASFYGGDLDDDLRSMTVDKNGVVYIAGTTLSTDLILSANAYQTMLGNTNVLNNGFLAVIDTNQVGAAGLIYGTMFGGMQIVEINAIASVNGLVYVGGWTDTDDLPITYQAFQATRAGGNDAFVAVFDPSQSGTASLIFCSYLGGYQQDVVRSIDVDPAGHLYVPGFTFSPNYPLTANAFQPFYDDGGGDAFLTEIDPISGAVLYSTYLGGTQADVGVKVVYEPNGHVAVAGYTYSPDFPRTPTAAQPVYGGNGDAFITELDLTQGNPFFQLAYSTFYGGSDADITYDMQHDANGLYYMCGYTFSKDLPVTSGALQPASAMGGVDGFVAVIDPTRSLIYGSYITSPGYQLARGIDYDASGNVYVTGTTNASIFPGNPQHTSGSGNYDAFLLVFAPK